MTYKNVAGLWKSKFVEGGLSFKMTQEIKDEMANIPVGVYVNVNPNKFKKEDKHPDYQVSYKDLEQTQVNNNNQSLF